MLEERNALIEARADLVKASSRLPITKILDPEEHRELSESSMREITKALRSGGSEVKSYNHEKFDLIANEIRVGIGYICHIAVTLMVEFQPAENKF
ncbi:MAG: hypothetical protein QXI59_06285 [Candidatus Bathyarchaeia archaeon]